MRCRAMSRTGSCRQSSYSLNAHCTDSQSARAEDSQLTCGVGELILLPLYSVLQSFLQDALSVSSHVLPSGTRAAVTYCVSPRDLDLLPLKSLAPRSLGCVPRQEWLTEWTQHLRPLNSCWRHDGTRRVNGRPAASRWSRSSSKVREQVLERARSTPGALRSGDGCGAAQSLAVCGTERQASRATAVTAATDRRAGTRRRGRQQAPRNAAGRRMVLAARRAGSGGAGGGGDAASGRWSRIAVQWLVEESHPGLANGTPARCAWAWTSSSSRRTGRPPETTLCAKMRLSTYERNGSRKANPRRPSLPILSSPCSPSL